MKSSIYQWILLCIAIIPVFPSCEEEPEDMFPERLFRPVTFSAIVDVNNVDFTWMPIEGASYLLELSRDSLKFETGLQSYSFSNVNKARIEDLWGNTGYSARIKAVSADPAVKDSKFKNVMFFIQAENIFAALGKDDIGTDRIRLNWDNTKPADRILVSTAGKDDVWVTLTAEELAAGQLTVTGLDPGTDYKFGIFLGNRNRGYVTVKTASIFSAIADADVTAYGVTLRWDNSNTPDRIVVSTPGVDRVTITLSDADVAAGQKIIDGLEPATPYVFRIYSEELALGKASVITKVENIFTALDNDDTGTDWIRLKWDNTKPTDRILVSTAGKDDVSIALTAEDMAAGQLTVTGLDPDTKYTFRLYLGERVRGSLEATTVSILP